MSERRRVIGSEHIMDAHRRGRQLIEVLPTDIVTQQATETAERLNVRLVDGPLERVAVAKTDAAVAMNRSLYRRSPRWISPVRSTPETSRRLGLLALVGAGGVGGNIAHLAANSGIAEDIALIDVNGDLASSIALDLNHASGISRSVSRVRGGSDMALMSDADVVVVTAGRPRTPGMDRSDLINVNRAVIHRVGESIRAHAPDAVVIVVTNPLDEMTVEMLRATGFERQQVLGMAGTLDSSRFRNALATAAGVAATDVEAYTLGSHGNEMAPIVSRATIKGRPLDIFLDEKSIQACVKDAITGGAQVVALKKTGSAIVAPAHATIELIEHIRGARTGPVPVSVMLDGEYGIHDVVLGVPCHLGACGLIEVEQVNLTESELKALTVAADAIRTRLAT